MSMRKTSLHFFVVAALILAGATHCDTHTRNFEACVAAVGPDFVAARDAYLQRPDRAALHATASDADWHRRAAAVILLGWLDHDSHFNELVSAPKVLTRSGARVYSWTRDPRQLSTESIPLLYELVLKRSQGDDAAREAASALISLSGRDSPIDDSIMIEMAIDQNLALPTRASAAYYMAQSEGRDREEQLDQLLAAVEAESNAAVSGSLLTAVANTARRATPERREAVVKQLKKSEQIDATAGTVWVVHAIGRIGGTRATEVVATYVGESDSLIEQRWGLNALGSMGTAEASRVLMEYALPLRVDEGLRLEAIRGLSRSKYSPEIGKALRAIAQAEERSMTERSEAIRSFNLLERTISPDHVPDLRRHLTDLREQDSLDEELARQLDSIIERMKPIE